MAGNGMRPTKGHPSGMTRRKSRVDRGVGSLPSSGTFHLRSHR